LAPIDDHAPTDVEHVRGMWNTEKGEPIWEYCAGSVSGRYFIDGENCASPRLADDYTHWHPLAPPPPMPQLTEEK